MMMSRPPARIAPGLVSLSAALLLVSGCSGSVSVGSAKSVDANELQTQVAKVLTDQDRTGVTVLCPDDLEGTTGATTRCDTTDDAGRMRATVTVTSVSGGDVKFDVDAVPVLAAEDAARRASEQLATQVGQSAPDVTCPDDLVGVVGTTLVCTLSVVGESYDTTLTVTDDGSGEIGFDIAVADAPS